jgi:RNA polymerase sigma-70 factor (ECF subfamily)
MRELVAKYESSVFGLCYRMLGHRQDAEDVTQEVFVRVFRSLERWDETRPFEPWLLAIAGNRCRTALGNRRKRLPSVEFVDDVPDSRGSQQPADQLVEEVRLALEDLKDEHRQAFLLFHESQLSYIEIGESLNCPVGTVKTWVHRARKQVIERLARRGVVFEVRNES